MRKSVFRARCLALFFSAVVLLAGLSARAEDSAAAPNTPKAAERPFADVPDAYFEEADRYLKYCEKHVSMSQYYNCECLSYEYLNTRIKKPKTPSSEIMSSLNKKCLDASKAAGGEYERCLGNAPMLPLNIKPEKFCECFANTYGKLFERYKTGISSKAFVQIQTQAYISCTDPQLAKKLYPYSTKLE